MAVVFTARELDIMAVLWDRRSATVAEVREHLNQALSHNTVATLLSILEKKGYVDHIDEGKAFRYRPRVDRAAAGRSAVSRVIDKIFAGSTKAFLAHFVRDRKLTEAELHEIRALLETASAGKTRPRRRRS